MIFTEYRFALFFGLVLAVHWALRSNRSRKIFLLLASWTFYSVWDWRFLSLLLASTLCDYFAALGIERSTSPRIRRAWLGFSLALNLGMLGIFKYLGFFVDSALEVAAWMGVHLSRPTLSIVLPIGISFYTFQTLAYTLDTYLGKQRATRSFLDVALFVGFFPQLVAGPILRPREFLPQLGEKRRWERVPVHALLWLFLVGYFKKSYVSDNISGLIDAYYADVGGFTSASGIVAGLFFSVQLYCDFSGYSDMAIATAGLLGYTLPMNFYFPLLSDDYTKLMNRWHMTLSRWVRDYVYLPLVGRSRSPLRQLWSLGLTMFLVGLWHGADWHFVVWGLGMGLGAVIHRVWKSTPSARHLVGSAATLVGLPLTYAWLVLMLVLFRADSLAQAGDVYRAWLGLTEVGARSFGTGPWLVFAALALLHYGFLRFRLERAIPELRGAQFAILMGVLVPLCLAFARADVQPFIYFQF